MMRQTKAKLIFCLTKVRAHVLERRGRGGRGGRRGRIRRTRRRPNKVCFCLEFIGVWDFLWFGIEISAPLV